jgi:hypothetical protein
MFNSEDIMIKAECLNPDCPGEFNWLYMVRLEAYAAGKCKCEHCGGELVSAEDISLEKELLKNGITPTAFQ